MNRLKQLIAALGAVGMIASAAPAAAESVLRVRPFGDLKQIDPVITSDYMVRNHGYMVYDTLFALDEAMQIKPQMLERWQVSSDGLVYTFVLRDKLAFHNGTPVTAADVVASLERWASATGSASSSWH